MFSRGNATSGAPICSGMTALPKPKNSGVANSSSMIVPCIVNSWLYMSSLTTWEPGCARLARMISAMMPADEEERERRDEVQVADDLVVGRRDDLDDPLAQGQLARDGAAAFERCGGCHQCSSPFSRPAISRRRAAPDAEPRPGRLLQLVQVLVELGPRHDVDLEDHARVVEAAQFGAAAGEGALARRRHVEGVDGFLPGNDVELEVELRDPERVDDVRRLQGEAHRLVDRQVQVGRVGRRADVEGVVALDGLLVEVVEGPLPLAADDDDLVIGVLDFLEHRVLRRRRCGRRTPRR